MLEIKLRNANSNKNILWCIALFCYEVFYVRIVFFSDFSLLYFNVYFLRKEKHHNDEEE